YYETIVPLGEAVERAAVASCHDPRFEPLRPAEADGVVVEVSLLTSPERVDAIVSNQYRKSYDKAAMVITACAEVLRLRGNDKEAGSLLNDVRNRFPRHRAFQAELNTAVQRMESSRR
ncbi:MAG: AMMECR1 domain-containing protein, partial [Acidobacteriota bacterium]